MIQNPAAFGADEHPKLIQLLSETGTNIWELGFTVLSKPFSYLYHNGSISRFIIVQDSYYLPTLSLLVHGFLPLVQGYYLQRYTDIIKQG